MANVLCNDYKMFLKFGSFQPHILIIKKFLKKNYTEPRVSKEYAYSNTYAKGGLKQDWRRKFSGLVRFYSCQFPNRDGGYRT